MGALANRDPSKRHHNHFATIEDALKAALPGDTIGKFMVYDSLKNISSLSNIFEDNSIFFKFE